MYPEPYYYPFAFHFIGALNGFQDLESHLTGNIVANVIGIVYYLSPI